MAAKHNRPMSELYHLTECCICLMPFTDPRMLPCIHSACLKCLEDIQTQNKKKPGDGIPCPVCRKEFAIPPSGMTGLQKNFFVANLLEIMQNLNEETTSQRCKTSKHGILEIKDNLNDEEILKAFSPPNCPNHSNKALDKYCGDCKTVVCVSCFAEKHKSHDCKNVATVDKDFRKDLESSSLKILHCFGQMETKRSKMEFKKKNLLERTSEMENSIRRQNQHLKAMIDQHTQLVLNELSSMKQKRLKNIETEIEEIERQMTVLKSFETYCSEIKSKGSPTDVCSCVDGLIRRADELRKENDKYLSLPDDVVEVEFNATDHNVLIRSSGNIIGKIEESTERVKSHAIVFGGSDGSSVFGDVTKINLHHSGDVLPLQKMPTHMLNESAAAANSNSIYITGLGNKHAEIWKFDATSDIWEKCASLVKGRRRHSVAFVDQFLYICGGYVDSDRRTVDDVEAYDAINDRCSSVGKLVHCVQSAGNCVAFNSSVYIFGGVNARNDLMSHVQVYDTKSNTCTLLSHSMPVKCSHMRAVLFEKTVILLGRSDCFLYDLDKRTWKERRQFKTGNYHFGMMIENSQLFVFGGGTDTTGVGGKSKWACRDDVRCIPVKNLMDDKAIEWRHHAKLTRRSLVFACEKI